MKDTDIIPCDHPLAIDCALEVIQAGGLIAFPTDTVYGLACSAFSSESITALFQAKGRDFNKAIAVLIGDLDQLNKVAQRFSDTARRLAKQFWPGALTLVMPRHASLPEIISPLPTVGVRMPDHEFALALLKQSGPLATTSANLAGGMNPLTPQDVLDQLDGRFDLLLNGGAVQGGNPSTVVDCTSNEIRILRVGAISPDSIFKTLHNED